MAGRLDFEYQFNTKSANKVADSMPMRVYFLGDFSGPISIAEHASANKIVPIDIDSFDHAMMQLKPTISLASGHQLQFNELEDFHPDNLYESDVFSNLKRLKKALKNPNTADEAAREIATYFQVEHSHTVNAETDIEDTDAAVERLLGKKPSSAQGTKTTTNPAVSKLDQYIADVISSKIIKDPNPEHQTLMMFIDNAIEDIMNAILHSKEFQSLEAAWRSVRDVVFNEHYDDEAQFFYLVNTDEAALQRAVSGDASWATTLSQHIRDTDVDSFNVLIGNYQFSADNDDITRLNYLASFAETQGCQLVSAAATDLVSAGPDSLWHEFRKLPQAKHIALTFPRVLLRTPYGEKQDEIEAFAFEEFRQSFLHDQLLWGNAAFACARLLVRQYHGQVTYDGALNELPAFVYEQDGEQKLYPCGEMLLSEQQLMAIRSQGILAFISFRDKNSIRLFGDEVSAVNG